VTGRTQVTALVVAGLLGSGLLAARAYRARSSVGAPASSSSSAQAKRPRAPLSVDPELAAAESAAISQLSEFRNALALAAPGTANFQVQALVRVGDSSERLWLAEVHGVDGGFDAVIDSAPKVLRTLQRGQSVHVWNEDVVDWAYDERNQSHGGETRRIIAKQRRTAELNDALPKCRERRFADGCAVLGGSYADGTVGEKNLEIARDLYTRACEGGSAFGCNSAGWASVRGRGGPQDLPAAAAFFARACATGDEHPYACDSRGFALITGLAGTKRDLTLGFRLLSKACTRGLPSSCLLLEAAKVKGLRSGPRLALACELNIAEQVAHCGDRDPEACFLAGAAFEVGLCEAPRSAARAAEFMRGAAEFGASWPSAARPGG